MQETISLIFIYLVILAIANGAFCAFLAKEKNRDGVSWFFAGLFFFIIALIAIAGAPIKEKKPDAYKYLKTG